MLRGVGAVVLGYIIMAVIVMIGSVALLASVVPGGMAERSSASSAAGHIGRPGICAIASERP